jgi:virulence-associated protein VagC|tara:strand:- start:4498 stop:5391 length:894 start_codon:yes stop_codon:yes gene_type:complete
MGLLDNQTQGQYYEATTGQGDYQFVSLENIISSFNIIHVGEGKLISKVSRTDIQFHAMRAIQELSYDVFRSIKSQEIEIPASLTMVLPQDYVNYVKLVRVDSNGIERILYPTGKTSNPFAIEQNADGVYQLEDTDNNSTMDSLKEQDPSNTWDNYKSQTPRKDVYTDDTTDLEIDNRGRRYGLDPQHSQSNGSFYIDYQRGFIHFSSALSGQTVTLKYISDGLGTDAEMVVHKFAEEAVYKCIMYGILSSRTNIPEYIIARFKKERFAETRKAKIRLSNIKIEEFTQVLKGMGKQIK